MNTAELTKAYDDAIFKAVMLKAALLQEIHGGRFNKKDLVKAMFFDASIALERAFSEELLEDSGE